MKPAPKPRPASVPRRQPFPAVRLGARTAQIGRSAVIFEKNPRTLVESTLVQASSQVFLQKSPPAEVYPKSPSLAQFPVSSLSSFSFPAAAAPQCSLRAPPCSPPSLEREVPTISTPLLERRERESAEERRSRTRRSAPRSAEATARACGHGDMAVDAAVLACSEQQTGGADMNRGYDREASSVPY